MKRQVNIKTLLLIPALLAISQTASAEIQGLTGTSFNLTAKTGHISTGDGNSLSASPRADLFVELAIGHLSLLRSVYFTRDYDATSSVDSRSVRPVSQLKIQARSASEWSSSELGMGNGE